MPVHTPTPTTLPDASHRRNGPGSATPTSYTWDNNGNRLTNGSTTYTYDQRNRLLTEGTKVNTWTARGTLDQTTQGSTTVDFDFDGLGHMTKSGSDHLRLRRARTDRNPTELEFQLRRP